MTRRRRCRRSRLLPAGQVKPRQHVVPFQHLHLRRSVDTERTAFPASRLRSPCDSAAGKDQRRRVLRILANSIARLRLSACISGSPAVFVSHFAQIVLDLKVDCDLRQRGRAIGAGDQERARPSRRSLKRTLSAISRVRAGNCSTTIGVARIIGASFIRPAPGIVVVGWAYRIVPGHRQRAAGEDVSDRRLADLRRAD